MFFCETKIFRYSLIIILCAAVCSFSDRCYGDIPLKTGSRAKENGGSFSASFESNKVENIFIEKKEEVSLAATLFLDFTLPGGGHFYRGDYVMGGAFLALKIGSGFMAWYFIRNWKEAEESYNESKSAGISTEERESEKRRYDRTAQYVTFTAALNILVYGVSALINYNSVMKTNETAYPILNISLSEGNKYTDEFVLNCGVYMRL